MSRAVFVRSLAWQITTSLTAPIVDNDESKDVLVRILHGHPLPETRRLPDHGAHLQLVVDLPGRPKANPVPVAVLAVRSGNGCARDDDRRRPAVVADGQVQRGRGQAADAEDGFAGVEHVLGRAGIVGEAGYSDGKVHCHVCDGVAELGDVLVAEAALDGRAEVGEVFLVGGGEGVESGFLECILDVRRAGQLEVGQEEDEVAEASDYGGRTGACAGDAVGNVLEGEVVCKGHVEVGLTVIGYGA